MDALDNYEFTATLEREVLGFPPYVNVIVWRAKSKDDSPDWAGQIPMWQVAGEYNESDMLAQGIVRAKQWMRNHLK